MSQRNRRLAVVMFTEVVDVGGLAGRDSEIENLVKAYTKIISPIVADHHGQRIARESTENARGGLRSWLAGPGLESGNQTTRLEESIFEFDKSANAIRCAVEVQKAVRDYNRSVTAKKELGIRIGIHLGEIAALAGDVLGEGINVASQLCLLSETGEVCVSKQVRDEIHDRKDLSFQSLGRRELKHLSSPLEVYKVVLPWEKLAALAEEMLESRRIAVLPFVSISPDPQDDYFADGLTEELIDRLSQVKDLEVIARTSVMVFKKKEKKAAEIGRELRAGSLVEGSVRKADSKIRVTAQLINANTEGHLWSSSYDKDLKDIFAVQENISQQVAEALKLKLLPDETKAIEKRPTDNIPAYSLYLKGHYYWNERTEEGVQKGIEYLNKAIAEDPEFAEAYSDLSDCAVVKADYGMMPTEEALSDALKYATKALEYDPSLSQPHAALGYVHQQRWNWAAAENEFTLALELNPNNVVARHWYALFCFWKGRKEEAILQWRRSRDLDPLSLIVSSDLGFALARAGKAKEGIALLKEALEINEKFPVARLALAYAYATAGMDEEAAREARTLELQESDPYYKANAAVVLAMTGRRDEATGILNQMLNRADRHYMDPVLIAEIYAALHDDSQTFRWLEAAAENRSSGLVSIKQSGAFDRLAHDPRFVKILQRIGLR